MRLGKSGPFVIGSSPTIDAPAADNAPRSCRSPQRPRSGDGTAAVMATGFSSSSPEPITRSIPSFRTPGIPKPHSGLAMNTASLSADARLHRSTLSGAPLASTSGLKSGRSVSHAVKHSQLDARWRGCRSYVQNRQIGGERLEAAADAKNLHDAHAGKTQTAAHLFRGAVTLLIPIVCAPSFSERQPFPPFPGESCSGTETIRPSGTRMKTGRQVRRCPSSNRSHPTSTCGRRNPCSSMSQWCPRRRSIRPGRRLYSPALRRPQES
jgi:hypothetical protein